MKKATVVQIAPGRPASKPITLGRLARRKHARHRVRSAQEKEGSITIYPSPLAQVHLIFLIFMAAVIAAYVDARFVWGSQDLFLGEFFGYPLTVNIPLLGLVPLVLLAMLAHRLLDRRYVLSEDYILEVEGLLAWRLRTVRLRYLHIRGLEVDRSILQNLFGVGDLRVGGETSPEDTDVVMYGIAHPEAFKDLIKERINRKLAELKSPQLVRQATG